MSGVFINYRGADSRTAAALIHQALVRQFGRDRVFLDSSSIQAGDDFVEVLLRRLAGCSVLLAVIGSDWLSTVDSCGRRKLDGPDDWVHRELAEAFTRRLRVIPILLEDARLPGEAELPEDIRELARRQYLHLRRWHFEDDLAALTRKLTEVDADLAATARRGRTSDGPFSRLVAGLAAPAVAGLALRRSPRSVQQGPPPRRAGVLPAVWNVPIRNRGFLGRDDLLTALRARLGDGGAAVVQALHGLGGVGKTQLATEYAHRFSAEYDLVWWIAAEKPGLIGEQLAALAIEADLVSPTADIETAVRKAKSHLHQHDRWLLLFDNAEDPTGLVPWLPSGPGHVVITSRNPGWGEVAAPVPVDVFSRAESVGLLRARLPELTDDKGGRLAEALGDLPLAIAQAAGTLAETGMTPAEYETALGAKASQILAESPPASYPVPLAAAIRLSVDRIATDNQDAASLLRLCAWLAPEPIPSLLFADFVREPLRRHRAIGRIARFGLARVDSEGLQPHRLTQAILRDVIGPETRQRVTALVVAVAPNNGSDPQNWPLWARLVPHILALDPAGTPEDGLRDVACNMLWYLLNRGETRMAMDLATTFRRRWIADQGSADPAVLWATNHLAQAYRDLGDLGSARPLDEEVFTRYREIHGENHPFTMTSANNLANDLQALGELEAARELHEDTFERRRRTLGAGHPNTLTSAHNLANVLRDLGATRAARELHEDTLERRRRVLGDDHLRTLRTANSLAADLVELGEARAARELHEDTLERRRRVLGDDHPDTLESAVNLAKTLHGLGQRKAARRLDRDIAGWQRRLARKAGSDHGAGRGP